MVWRNGYRRHDRFGNRGKWVEAQWVRKPRLKSVAFIQPIKMGKRGVEKVGPALTVSEFVARLPKVTEHARWTGD
jgi:hypothetical protein